MSKGERVSTAIVQELATVEGVEPEELPPLYDAIDTDALDTLIHQSDTDDVTIGFDYGQYRIHVEGTGEITVTPSEPRTDDVGTKSCCD